MDYAEASHALTDLVFLGLVVTRKIPDGRRRLTEHFPSTCALITIVIADASAFEVGAGGGVSPRFYLKCCVMLVLSFYFPFHFLGTAENQAPLESALYMPNVSEVSVFR